MGDPLRDAHGLSRRLLRLRASVLQFGHNVRVPVLRSSIQIASGEMFGFGDVRDKAAAQPGSDGFHPLRGSQHHHRYTLLGVNFWHQCYQYRVQYFGKLLHCGARY